MLRPLVLTLRSNFKAIIQKRAFLTKTYECSEAWNSRLSSSILNKVNLEDLYNSIDQNYNSKDVISAIDVDIFANSIDSSFYIEELRDLIHKLRLSAETGNTLESTHYATVRNYIEYGDLDNLISILKDPLNYGIFMDNFTAIMLLDRLIKKQDYEKASVVANIFMLQEDFSNDITCAFCQYVCYKYIQGYEPPAPEESSNIKGEEVKIRIKYLRNPYFDDHFDIKDNYIASGKTLAWISEKTENILNWNLQLLGWVIYGKGDKLLHLCETSKSMSIYKEILDIINREKNKTANEEMSAILNQSLHLLNQLPVIKESLVNALEVNIEDAINKQQKEDIQQQEQLFQTWEANRQENIKVETLRLDRAKRLELIKEQESMFKTQEQKLWFFENEDKMDLEIEEKELKESSAKMSNKKTKDVDQNYIPPEILPKRR